MKRNLLFVLTIISVTFMLFSGCGSTVSKVSPVENFSNSIKTISEDNSELAGYSMDGLVEQGNGVYTANAVVDGKTVGAISIHIDNEQITEFLFSFSADGPVQREYLQPMIASAMAIDSTLDYLSAEDIMKGVNDILVFGGEPLENNGFAYWGWLEGNMCFVKIYK